MKEKWSIDNLREIWQLVTRLHQGQEYSGPKEGEQFPYINHIGSVTFEILAAIDRVDNMDADLAIKCALLHDSIEDIKFTFEQVQEQFGSTVAAGVLALTKNETIKGKENQMRDSLIRIKQQTKEVWAVKLADRICNLSPPPYYWTKEKIQAYLVEAQLIHQELKEGNSYLADRLANKIIAYKKFIV